MLGPNYNRPNIDLNYSNSVLSSGVRGKLVNGGYCGVEYAAKAAFRCSEEWVPADGVSSMASPKLFKIFYNSNVTSTLFEQPKPELSSVAMYGMLT